MMSPSSIDQGSKCNWPMPLAAAGKSLTGNQTGYASRLHCLHEAMD